MCHQHVSVLTPTLDDGSGYRLIVLRNVSINMMYVHAPVVPGKGMVTVITKLTLAT